MITRLQLGASRLEEYSPKILRVFLDKTWMHLGGSEYKKHHLKRYSIFYLVRLFKEYGIAHILRESFRKILGRNRRSKATASEIDELYNRTNFKEFYYHKGDALPFDENCINFIFSEHFFEHLFLDEALSLLKECYRILKPFGVIRTCVPDADLRTYAPAEPLAVPSTKVSYTHPSRHKTRWSVYSLTEALKIAGFKAILLRYCDKSGRYIRINPSNIKMQYEHCPEREMIFDLSYIKRIDSLIIDGIKKPSK